MRQREKVIRTEGKPKINDLIVVIYFIVYFKPHLEMTVFGVQQIKSLTYLNNNIEQLQVFLKLGLFIQ